MVTTAMLSFLSFVDDQHLDDNHKLTNRLVTRNAVTSYTFDSAATATVAESLDPTSPNYMKFALPGGQPTGCTTPTTQTFTATGDTGFYNRLFSLFMGNGLRISIRAPGTNAPGRPSRSRLALQRCRLERLARMVEIHSSTPNAAGAEPVPVFDDSLKLRAATEHHAPHRPDGLLRHARLRHQLGHEHHERRPRHREPVAHRRGIGTSIAGDEHHHDLSRSTSDRRRTTRPTPACAGCHAQLDPFKQFFRQSYSLYYIAIRLDPVVISSARRRGSTLDGVNTERHGPGRRRSRRLNIFANHPRLPLAWAAKLQFWANSTPGARDRSRGRADR